MSQIKHKLLDVLRNIKSDAVPQSPRAENLKPPNLEDKFNKREENEKLGLDNDPTVKEKKSKKDKKSSIFGKNYTQNRKNNLGSHKPKDNITVNTQATGEVINIVNSDNIHWGNQFVYHLGSSHQTSHNVDDDYEEHIEKDNLITLLLEAKILPEHQYIDYIAKNLGKNWHSFFRSLGYTKGRIETVEIDEARNGVSEARYKLLLDWARNDDDGTLGRLSTFLWEHGDRQIVKELALIYKNNK